LTRAKKSSTGGAARGRGEGRGILSGIGDGLGIEEHDEWKGVVTVTISWVSWERNPRI
jgi:hypothetical protein